MDSNLMTYDEWHALGVNRDWVGAAVCATHDGVPTTAGEDNAHEEGEDPCVHILRLYPDTATKLQVEENHSPSMWRK